MLIKKPDGSISIPNRRAVDYAVEKNLPELSEVLGLFPNDSIADGEIVAYSKDGKIDRILAQRRCGTTLPHRVAYLKTQIPIFFYAFDLLKLRGVDYETKPFQQRKDALKDFISEINHPTLKLLWYQTKDFRKLFDSEKEGVMTKLLWSRYLHARSSYWKKIKHTETETVEIVGWTSGKGKNSELFGSLICIKDGQYVGNCGGGFTDEERRRVFEILSKSPRMPVDWKLTKEGGEPYTAVKTELKLIVLFNQKTYKNHNFSPRLAEIIYPKQLCAKTPTLFLGEQYGRTWRCWRSRKNTSRLRGTKKDIS